MCGRTSCALEPDTARQALANAKLPCEKWIDQEKYKPSYNVAPMNFQPVVRIDSDASEQFILHSMQWGLVPSWTKNPPDYKSMVKAINCRYDSLIDGKPMFNSMKSKKRCIVLAEGFYEWLKPKQGGNGSTPHFTRRKDGQPILFAGLYDCCAFEGKVPLFTYTIITTSSSDFLSFLHDRMPAILENGSEDLYKWLDPNLPWGPEVAKLIKPYEGDLECYPVTSKVGKVGTSSPDFIVPLSQNKSSISNFFSRASLSKATSNKADPSEDTQLPSTSPTKRSRSLTPPSDITSSPEKADPFSPPTTPKKLEPVSLPSPKKTKLSSPRKASKEEEKAKGSAKITSFFRKSE